MLNDLYLLKLTYIKQLNIKKKSITLLAILVLGILFNSFLPPRVDAAINNTLNFQSKIINRSSGLNISNESPACVVGGADTCDFRIRIWNLQSGGTITSGTNLMYEELFTNVEIGDTNGTFNLSINSICAATVNGTSSWGTTGVSATICNLIDDSDSDSDLGVNFDRQDLFLELTFDPSGVWTTLVSPPGGIETFARTALRSVPSAFVAQTLSGIGSNGFVQIAPTVPQQTGNASSTIISVDENGEGSPNFLNFFNNGNSVLRIDNSGNLFIRESDANGFIKLGNQLNNVLSTTIGGGNPSSNLFWGDLKLCLENGTGCPSNGDHQMINNSGLTLNSGTVVVLDLANENSFTTTTIPNNERVIGVLTTGSCGNLSTCSVRLSGVVNVNVDAPTVVGEYLYTSTTIGKAKRSNSPMESGLIGVSLSSDSSAPYVVQVLISRSGGSGGGGIYTKEEIVAPGSYLELVHSQNTNSIVASGWVESTLGKWDLLSDKFPETSGGNSIYDINVGLDVYRVHVFTATGSANFSTPQDLNVEYLIIGGGGGGGGSGQDGRYGGGGGAGGYLTGAISLSEGSYPITVGSGGAGTQLTYGANGVNSFALGFTAYGGGGGGTSGGNGQNGGSGGGGGNNGGIGGVALSGQGFGGSSGSAGSGNSYLGAGGGGGASSGGGAPGSPNYEFGGKGGDGLSSSITGTAVTRGGGGSGARYTVGGSGGGGQGSNANSPGGNGSVNTGGGGGGSAGSTGGNGGSGIVVIRYKKERVSPVKQIDPNTVRLYNNSSSAQKLRLVVVSPSLENGSLIPLSNLVDSASNLSLSMGSYTSVFTSGSSTGTNNLWTYKDTASNTGTGYLFNLETSSGSLLNPLRVSSTGIERFVVDSSGRTSIGSGAPSGLFQVGQKTQYSKSITITNPGSLQYNYHALIEVDTATLIAAGKMQSDCDDVRFFNQSQSIPLYYFIESGCNTTTTQIWVEIPTLAGSGDTIINLNYGNPTMTNAAREWSGISVVIPRNANTCQAGGIAFTELNTLNRFPRGSTVYGGTGTGYHDHVISGNTSTQASGPYSGSGVAGSGSHSHTYSMSTSSVMNLPSYEDFVYCSYEKIPNALDTNNIVMFDVNVASLPVGWSSYSSMNINNRFPRGSVTAGGSGVGVAHSHTFSGSTGSGGGGSQYTFGSISNASPANHSHSIPLTSTGSTESLPPYLDVVFSIPNYTVNLKGGIIVIFNSTHIPPLGWDRFTPLDNRFPRGNITPGGTGGSDTHTHTYSFTTGSSGNNAQASNNAQGGFSAPPHTHTASGLSSSGSSLPAYLDVIYAKRRLDNTLKFFGTESFTQQGAASLLIEDSGKIRLGGFSTDSSALLTVCDAIRTKCVLPSPTSTVMVVGSIDDTASGSSIRARGTITGGLADIGEYAEVEGDVSNYSQGDLLSISVNYNERFRKSSEENDPYLVGVVTTTAGIIAGGGDTSIEFDSNGKPLNRIVMALAGRVPVKIDPQSSQIRKGNYITSSNTQGFGQLAKDAGRVIGRSLEDWDPKTNKDSVLIFLQPGEISLKQLNIAHSLHLVEQSPVSFVINDGITEVEKLLNDFKFIENISSGKVRFNSDVNIVGGLTLDGDLFINGGLKILGHVTVGVDTAGVATIPSGSEEVRINFSTPYLKRPVPVISVKNRNDIDYAIKDEDENGFTIFLATAVEENVEFNWHVLTTN